MSKFGRLWPQPHARGRFGKHRWRDQTLLHVGSVHNNVCRYSFLSPFELRGDVPLGWKALGGARATGSIFDTNGRYSTVVKPGSAAVKLAGENFSLIILYSAAIHGSSKTTSHLHGIRLTTTLERGVRYGETKGSGRSGEVA